MIGKDYVPNDQIGQFLGPTFGGTIPDMMLLMKSISQGEFGDERTVTKAKGLIPFNNLPLVNEGLNYMIEEEF